MGLNPNKRRSEKVQELWLDTKGSEGGEESHVEDVEILEEAEKEENCRNKRG